MNVGGVILLLLITLALWVLYHKIFDVYYFDTIGGLGKEFIVCFILSFIVMAILKKIGKVLLIIFVIGIAIAVVLALLGVIGSKNTDAEKSDESPEEKSSSDTSSNNSVTEAEVEIQSKGSPSESEITENI